MVLIIVGGVKKLVFVQKLYIGYYMEKQQKHLARLEIILQK